MSTNKLEFVFYQNPLSVLYLDAIGIEDQSDVLVVELSASSVLAPVFDQQAKLRFGLAGLLGNPDRIDQVPRQFRSSQREVLLGSRPSVSVHSSVSALSELARMSVQYSRIVVLLHLSEIDKFIYGLQLASSFCVLLKLGDAVPVTLLRAVDRLERLGVVNERSWKGLAFFGDNDEAGVNTHLLDSIEEHLRPLVSIGGIAAEG